MLYQLSYASLASPEQTSLAAIGEFISRPRLRNAILLVIFVF